MNMLVVVIGALLTIVACILSIIYVKNHAIYVNKKKTEKAYFQFILFIKYLYYTCLNVVTVV